jgi:glutathione S-transferase
MLGHGYILHYAPDNASLIVRLALLELGLPFQTRLVDRTVRAQDSASYRALAPTGLIPALDMGDQVMFETGAILLALADRAPPQHRGKLFPAPDAPQRGDALKWLFFMATTLHADCRLHFYPDQYAGQSTAPPVFCAATRARLLGHMGLIEGVARAQPDLFWHDGAHDCPSLLTLYTLPLTRWLRLYPEGQKPWLNLADFPCLYALAGKLETRGSAQQAAQDEGLGPTPFTAPTLPNPPEGSPT